MTYEDDLTVRQARDMYLKESGCPISKIPIHS